MNSPMKFGLVCVLCVLCAGASVAAEVEVSIPNGSTTWTSAIAGKTINEGDTLSVTIGDNLTSYSLGGWVSPKLAGVKVSGNKAWNVSNGTFNFQPAATFEAVGTTRVILNTVQLNPASALSLEKTGTGTLQFLGVQSCPALKLTISAGNVYVHQDAALGVVPTTVVADAITLNGGTLYNGFSNTSLGTVTLSSTRGIAIASGKTGAIAVIASEVAGQLASDFIIRGPISGDGDLSIATTSVKVNGSPVYVTIAGACTYTGDTTVSNAGYLSFEPGGSLPASTTLTAGSASLTVALNGTSQTVGALANNSFRLAGPGLLTVTDHTLFPAPTCQSGAAIAIDASEIETAQGKAASYAVVDADGKVTKLLANASYCASSLPRVFEFRFTETWSNDAACVSVSEIELTKGGMPIDRSCYDLSKCTATSTGTGFLAANLFDCCGNTYWESAIHPSRGPVAVRVALKGSSAGIDGYRIGAGRTFNCGTNPKSWRVVEIGADGTETEIDAKTGVMLAPRYNDLNVTTVGFAGDLSINVAFADRPAPAVRAGLDLGSGATYAVGAGDGQALGALTGSGTLALGAGSETTADLSEFEGRVRADGEATLNLSVSTRIGATEAGASAVVYKDATTGVNLILDDTSSAAPLRGKLSGALGLVKSGSGERVLQTERSDSTGKVLVEGGTLTVSAMRSSPVTTVTARYVQFVPLQNAFKSTSPGINVSLNEFELLDEVGNKVNWPSGKTISAPEGVTTAASGTSTSDIAKIIDGNIATRCFLNSTGTGIVLSPFTVDTKTGVTFAKYRWYTAMNTSNSSYNSDKGRTPIEWEIRVSDDNATWRTVHHGTGDVNDYGSDITDWKDSNGFLRGPYDVDLAGSVPAPEFGALPTEMVVKDDAADTVAAAVKARYLRFMPFATANDPVRLQTDFYTSSNFGCAFSEFDIYRNGERVAWNGATASVPNAYLYADGIAANMIDNIWNSSSKRFYSFVFPFDAIIDAGADKTFEFDAYGFHNDTANGGRRPAGWKLWISNDQENWYLVDELQNQTSESAAQIEAGRWSLAGKLSVTNTFTTTAIGDVAPVEIATGATLKLDTDREAFGALSGAGTLELVRGAVAVVNAAAGDTGFSGAVTGAGKLVIAGEGVQTFDGATLDGGVTLSFAGGALAGGLAVDGSLEVEGDVKFAVPADATRGYSQQLLSWTSIDDGSKAKLQAATIVNGSDLKTKNFKLIVSDTGCTLKYETPGMAIIVR